MFRSISALALLMGVALAHDTDTDAARAKAGPDESMDVTCPAPPDRAAMVKPPV